MVKSVSHQQEFNKLEERKGKARQGNPEIGQKTKQRKPSHSALQTYLS